MIIILSFEREWLFAWFKDNAHLWVYSKLTWSKKEEGSWPDVGSLALLPQWSFSIFIFLLGYHSGFIILKRNIVSIFEGEGDLSLNTRFGWPTDWWIWPLGQPCALVGVKFHLQFVSDKEILEAICYIGSMVDKIWSE